MHTTFGTDLRLLIYCLKFLKSHVLVPRTWLRYCNDIQYISSHLKFCTSFLSYFISCHDFNTNHFQNRSTDQIFLMFDCPYVSQSFPLLLWTSCPVLLPTHLKWSFISTTSAGLCIRPLACAKSSEPRQWHALSSLIYTSKHRLVGCNIRKWRQDVFPC